LGVGRHGVSLVEDEQLEGRAGVPRRGRADRSRREVLDLGPDDADAALVGRVQLQDARLEEVGAERERERNGERDG